MLRGAGRWVGAGVPGRPAPWELVGGPLSLGGRQGTGSELAAAARQTCRAHTSSVLAGEMRGLVALDGRAAWYPSGLNLGAELDRATCQTHGGVFGDTQLCVASVSPLTSRHLPRCPRAPSGVWSEPRVCRARPQGRQGTAGDSSGATGGAHRPPFCPVAPRRRSAASTGRTRAAGPTDTSACAWRTARRWWTTPSASSASSR